MSRSHESEITSLPLPADRCLRLQVIHRNRMYRECLQAVLTRDRQFEIVEAEAGAICFEESQPDVILIDLLLGEQRTIDLIYQARREAHHAKILVLVSSAATADLVEFITAGVHGCVMDDSSVEELRRAIVQVLADEPFYSPDVVRSVFRQFAALRQESHWRRQAASASLTSRELEILELISMHLSNKQIAKRLRVSLYTVKNHIHNMLEKLHVASRFEAVEYAYQRQWIPRATHEYSTSGITTYGRSE